MDVDVTEEVRAVVASHREHAVALEAFRGELCTDRHEQLRQVEIRLRSHLEALSSVVAAADQRDEEN